MKKSEEPVTLTNASYGGKGKGRAILTCSFLLHVALFAYWIAVHVHESSLMANAEFFSKGQHHFAKMSEFPGRWKYLTLVNMCLQTIFFGLSCIGHFLPSGRLQKIFMWFLDMMFTTIVFPTTFLICSVFWPIYLVDSDSIYPNILQKLLPSYLNHIYHTAIVVTVLLELFTVCHHYPGALLGVFVMGSFNFGYLCLMIYSLFTRGTWPYRFMNKLSQPGLLTFFGISFLLYVAMYYIGKMLSHLRWGERLRHVKED